MPLGEYISITRLAPFRLWRTSALRQHMTDAAFYRAADTLIGVIAELGKRRWFRTERRFS